MRQKNQLAAFFIRFLAQDLNKKGIANAIPFII
jgi:hypothetical protein